MASSVKCGYWPAYSYSYFPPSAVDSSLFTHIFYAFADLNAQSFEVTISAENRQSVAQFTSTLQRRNPSLKTLLSIGGAVEGLQNTFAAMAADPTTRTRFIESSIALARQYSFHGLDLDWQYPANMNEMNNWGRLLAEWRSAVESEAPSSGKPKLILTAAVYYSHKFLVWGEPRKFPIDFVTANLDWVNIITYDFHGTWTPDRTGAHAALKDPKTKLSSSYGVESWLDAGLSPTKVVMGIPIYGHSWKLRSASQVGIGAPALGAGVPDYVQGTMSYGQIQEWIQQKGAKEVYDGATVSAYCYSGLDWIGYDNEQSVKVKVEFAKSKGLRGYFFWNVTQDSNWALCRRAAQTLG